MLVLSMTLWRKFSAGAGRLLDAAAAEPPRTRRRLLGGAYVRALDILDGGVDEACSDPGPSLDDFWIKFTLPLQRKKLRTRRPRTGRSVYPDGSPGFIWEMYSLSCLEVLCSLTITSTGIPVDKLSSVPLSLNYMCIPCRSLTEAASFSIS